MWRGLDLIGCAAVLQGRSDHAAASRCSSTRFARLRSHACSRDRAEQQKLGSGGASAGPGTGEDEAHHRAHEGSPARSLATYRARAAAAGHQIERVVSIYEAGWSGFWLARWLITQ